MDVNWHFSIALAQLSEWHFEDAIPHFRTAFKGGSPAGVENIHTHYACALLYVATPERVVEARQVLVHGLTSKKGLDVDALFMLTKLYHQNTTMAFDLKEIKAVVRHVTKKGWMPKNIGENKYTGQRVTPGFKVPEFFVSRDPETGEPDWSQITECERLRSPCLFRAYNYPNRGVEGAKDTKISDLLGWKTDKWDEEYLVKHTGHVSMQVERRTNIGDKFGSGHHYQHRKFKDVLRNFRLKQEKTYLGLQQEAETMYQPPLNILADRGDLPEPAFLKAVLSRRDLSDPKTISWGHMWLGGDQAKDAPTNVNSTTSMLHVDPYDNINCLIKGKKRFLIFSPADAHNLYINGRIEGINEIGELAHAADGRPKHVGFNFALVDPEEPDLELFPKFADAMPVEFTIEGGDMMYLPVGWFHQVSSWHPTLGINFWFEPHGISPLPVKPVKA